MLNFSFVQGIKPLFISLLIIFICVGGLTVNPVSRGIGSIYNKTVSQKILEIKKKSPEQKWMAVNTNYLGNLLVALGVKTFNSMHYYPDLKMWKLLDTENKYDQIYNRNANVEVQFTEEKTHFKLPYPNNFILYLNKVDLKKVGVKYLLSNGQIKDNLFLKEIDRVYKDNIYLYEVAENYQILKYNGSTTKKNIFFSDYDYLIKEDSGKKYIRKINIPTNSLLNLWIAVDSTFLGYR
jgi:hypothetical protein